METFFTSDLHFNHNNILQWRAKKFPTLFDMEEELIQNWNSVVTPKDIIYVLGDFAISNATTRSKIENILLRLRGKKILIIGNHDDVKIRGWQEVHERKEIRVGQKRFLLNHYPFDAWSNMGRILHLHGHTHGNSRPLAGRLDVGVDVWGGKPITVEEIYPVIGTCEKTHHSLSFRPYREWR